MIRRHKTRPPRRRRCCAAPHPDGDATCTRRCGHEGRHAALGTDHRWN